MPFGCGWGGVTSAGYRGVLWGVGVWGLTGGSWVRIRTKALGAAGSPARIRTLSCWYQKPVCCQLHHGGQRLRPYRRRA
ncbi:hypothetical protein STAFG_2667 [Streptomyces afghaniensis 772]|uniref:Uncharacterized protein n=1 Tax=Streptomyces afghaniensis 772 TaxID=1283301 RepID=S4N124_9ACTN|nr:hypothetical protein STAFG_2667 [Streptomyces afghaniensis 772]